MKFRITRECNVWGYLKSGHLEGIVEAKTQEDALEKLKNEDVKLKLVVDNYHVNWYVQQIEPESAEVTEIKEGYNLNFSPEEIGRIAIACYNGWNMAISKVHIPKSGDNIDEDTEKYIKDLRNASRVYYNIIEKLNDAVKREEGSNET